VLFRLLHRLIAVAGFAAMDVDEARCKTEGGEILFVVIVVVDDEE